MKARKTLAMFLTAAMLLSMFSLSAFAAEGDTAPALADAESSWAADSINRWVQLGVVKGDTNGNFNPANPLSRGELATILVNMFGLTEKAENTYADLKGDEWYADAILKCTAAGIMKGDGANCNATAQISRQETMVMFGRAVGVTPVEEPDMSKFTDADEVADWAAGYMAPLAEMGIITGAGDGSVAPAANIDRASMMALLDKAIVEYVNAPGEVAVDNANGFVIVNVPAAEGEVVLTGSAAGVVVAAGTTDAKVVAKDLTADTVKVDGAAPVSVEGKSEVGTVAVNAADAKLTVAGTVGSVTVAETAANTEIKAEAGAKIDSVENAAKGLSVAGKGSVGTVSTTTEAKVSTPNTVTTQTETKTDADGNTVITKTETTNNSKGEAGSVKTETTTTKPDGTTDTKTETEKPSKPSTGGSYVPTSITVSDEEALTNALANSQYSTITLGADITITQTVVITRGVTLDGGTHKITFEDVPAEAVIGRKSALLIGDGADRLTSAVTIQNLTVEGPNTTGDNTWDEGEYGIKVYNAENVTLNNVTVTSANAGIQVNSSSVKLSGTITVTGNEFGGIEVCKSETLEGATAGILDINGATVACTDTDVPAIWIDGTTSEAGVVSNAQTLYFYQPDGKAQIHYYTAVMDAECLRAAIANGGEITLGADISLGADMSEVTPPHTYNDTKYVAQLFIPAGKAITLNLNGYTLSSTAVKGYMIFNCGTLTIDGTVANSSITAGFNGESEKADGKTVRTLMNYEGTVTVNGGHYDGYYVFNNNVEDKSGNITDSTITINDAEIMAGFAALSNFTNSKITATGCTIKAYYYGVVNNGTYGNTEFDISSGSIASTADTAIYFPAGNTLTLNDVTVSAPNGSGIEAFAGAVTLKGNTEISAGASYQATVSNENDGSRMDGSAVLLGYRSGYKTTGSLSLVVDDQVSLNSTNSACIRLVSLGSYVNTNGVSSITVTYDDGNLVTHGENVEGFFNDAASYGGTVTVNGEVVSPVSE